MPRSRSRAAHWCSDQWRSSQSSSQAVATLSGVQPTKQVSAASDARSRAVGRSSASSRRSQSRAGSVPNTEPEPPMTAGTPALIKAFRTVKAWPFVRTSTAM